MKESFLPKGIVIADGVARFLQEGGQIADISANYHNEDLAKWDFTFHMFTDNFTDAETRNDPVRAAKKLQRIFPVQQREKANSLRSNGGVPHANHADAIEAMALQDLIPYTKRFVDDFMKSVRRYPFTHSASINAGEQADKWLTFSTVAAIAAKIPYE